MEEPEVIATGALTLDEGPGAAGASVVTEMVLPVMQAIGPLSQEESAQFYAGAVGALLGFMAADYGKPMAVALGKRMVDSFASSFEPPPQQGTH